jgi:hypothetical protein
MTNMGIPSQSVIQIWVCRGSEESGLRRLKPLLKEGFMNPKNFQKGIDKSEFSFLKF